MGTKAKGNLTVFDRCRIFSPVKIDKSPKWFFDLGIDDIYAGMIDELSKKQEAKTRQAIADYWARQSITTTNGRRPSYVIVDEISSMPITAWQDTTITTTTTGDGVSMLSNSHTSTGQNI